MLTFRELLCVLIIAWLLEKPRCTPGARPEVLGPSPPAVLLDMARMPEPRGRLVAHGDCERNGELHHFRRSCALGDTGLSLAKKFTKLICASSSTALPASMWTQYLK